MKSWLASLVVMAVSFSASAELLTLKAGSASKNGVNISESATVTGTQNQLITVGSGTRTKTVVVLPINVYVAQLMVADKDRFVKTDSGALPSLQNEKQTAIRLTFLRTVDAATVMTNFKTSLDANKVSAQDPAITAFLAAVSKGGEAKQGTSMTILITKNADGSETVNYENGTSAADPVTGQDLTNKIMSIWLGVVGFDDGLKSLKAEILK